MIRSTQLQRKALRTIQRMGSCLAKEANSEDNDGDSSNQLPHGRTDGNAIPNRKPRILCLHGWRTNGEILSMQMAALQANTCMDCVFIDAPFPGRGEPDKGIAFFYPDRPYYEWFYRTKVATPVPELKSDENTDEIVKIKSTPFAGYDNLEESMKYLADHLRTEGPYDGLLGFSQGASMVTRLVNLQEQSMKTASDAQLPYSKQFKFAILIGGVPPQVNTTNCYI